MISLGELVWNITGDATQLNRELDKSKKRVMSFGDRLKSIGAGVTKGLGIIATAFTAIGLSTIKAASNAAETRNKFNVVFRDLRKESNQTAKGLQKDYGLSSRAAQQLLADTGDLLTGFGFTQKSALDLSREVNKLAVDLASFTNYSGGAEGASKALTSGLLGEREAMKSLGIAITEADIKQLAEDKGIVGELDRQTKALITYELAVKQSKNAIGDFSRSQAEFANQQRIAEAQWEDFIILIGEKFLPLGVEVLGMIISLTEELSASEDIMIIVEAAVQGLSLAFEVLGGAVKIVAGIIRPFAQAFSDFLEEQKTAATVARIMADETKEQNKAYEINQKRVDRLLDRYKKLEEEQKDGIDNTKEMTNIISTINSIYPDLIKNTDDSAISYRELSTQVKSYSDQLLRSLEIEEARKELIQKRENLKAITEPYEKQVEAIDKLNNKLTEYEGALASKEDFEISYNKSYQELFKQFRDVQPPELIEILGETNLDKLFRYTGGDEIKGLVDGLLGFDDVSEAFKVANKEFQDAQKNLDALGESILELPAPGTDQGPAPITIPKITQDDIDQEKEFAQVLHDFKVELVNSERENFIDSLNQKYESYKKILGDEITIDGEKYNLDLLRIKELHDYDTNIKDMALEDAYKRINDEEKAFIEAEKAKQAELEKTAELHREVLNLMGNATVEFVNNAFEARKSGLDRESEEYKKAALDQFNFNQAVAAVNATISGIEAVQKIYSSIPPPFGTPLAVLMGLITAGNVAAILAKQPPNFEQGGVVPGTSYRGDNVPILANSGEMVLNQDQQSNLLDIANGGGTGGPFNLTVMLPDGRDITAGTVKRINNREFLIDARAISEDL